MQAPIAPIAADARRPSIDKAALPDNSDPKPLPMDEPKLDGPNLNPLLTQEPILSVGSEVNLQVMNNLTPQKSKVNPTSVNKPTPDDSCAKLPVTHEPALSDKTAAEFSRTHELTSDGPEARITLLHKPTLDASSAKFQFIHKPTADGCAGEVLLTCEATVHETDANSSHIREPDLPKKSDAELSLMPEYDSALDGFDAKLPSTHEPSLLDQIDANLPLIHEPNSIDQANANILAKYNPSNPLGSDIDLPFKQELIVLNEFDTNPSVKVESVAPNASDVDLAPMDKASVPKGKSKEHGHLKESGNPVPGAHSLSTSPAFGIPSKDPANVLTPVTTLPRVSLSEENLAYHVSDANSPLAHESTLEGFDANLPLIPASTLANESNRILPPELMSMIMSYMSKKQLKTLRQVCKAYNEATFRFLFNQVYISSEPNELRTAKIVCLQYGPYIKTLIYPHSIYQEVTRAECERIDVPNIQTEKEWAGYLKGKKERKDVEDILEHVFFLYRTISTLKNLRKVVLTDAWCKLAFTMRVHGSETTEVYPIDRQGLTVGGHNRRIFPISGLSVSDSQPWQNIMVALDIPNSLICELAVEPLYRDEGTALPASAFHCQPREIHTRNVIYSRLKKLRLSLCSDDVIESDDDDDNNNDTALQVTRAISAAINLEYLCLDLAEDFLPWNHPNPDRAHTSFDMILGSCRFPKLKSLILVNFESTAGELRRLIKACAKTLEHLTIDTYMLSSGLWEHLFSELRDTLHLKSVFVTKVCGGLRQPYDELVMANRCDATSKFFFGGGRNPYTVKALDAWHKRMNGQIHLTRTEYQGGWEGRYRELHENR